jgi:hypothetical protein
MSDYLWDKNGEPDGEVERLEELLGSFGHKPRALELPSEAAPATSPALRPRLFRPALLAAAALLLMALAGAALVMLRQGGADVNQQAANPAPKETPPQGEVAAPPDGNTPSPGPREREAEPTRGDVQVKKSLPPDSQASSKRRQQRRQPPPFAPGAGASRQPPEVAARQEPPAATSVERQAAKEQLVYALRLASAKLGEVRKMTRGEEAPRHSFNERDRIR